MRGYEHAVIGNSNRKPSVTNPHEGLWALLSVGIASIYMCYESPWGVMRVIYASAFKSKKLVTNPHEGLWVARSSAPTALIESYESPWGVMSWHPCGRSIVRSWLRIPMRGYEWLLIHMYGSRKVVTNPHEGLWAIYESVQQVNTKQLRIPMRGYEPRERVHSALAFHVTNPHEGLWGYLHL